MSFLFAVKVNPVQSRLLQLALFNAGCLWADGKKEVADVRFAYLFLDNNKSILRSTDNDDNEREITFEAAMEYALTGKKMWVDAVELQIGQNKAFVVPGEYIKVGCTTIKSDDIEKLIKAYRG